METSAQHTYVPKKHALFPQDINLRVILSCALMFRSNQGQAFLKLKRKPVQPTKILIKKKLKIYPSAFLYCKQ